MSSDARLKSDHKQEESSLNNLKQEPDEDQDDPLEQEPKLATETPKDEFVIKGEMDSKLEPETVNSSDFNKDSDVYSPPQAKKKKKGFGNYECADCDYGTDSYGKLRRHKLALHEGEPKYPCNQCTFAAAMLSHLKAHKETEHDGNQHPCDQCEFIAPKLSKLKQHIASEHDAIRHSCDKCKFSSARAANLKAHIERMHTKIKAVYTHQCDQCEFTTDTTNGFKVHIAALHGGVLYSCRQCPFMATLRESLSNHKTSQHEPK